MEAENPLYRRYPKSKIYLNIINSFLKHDLAGLVRLNGDNFDRIVNGKRSVLCMFYKKDCSTCEEVTKEFISSATTCESLTDTPRQRIAVSLESCSRRSTPMSIIILR